MIKRYIDETTNMHLKPILYNIYTPIENYTGSMWLTRALQSLMTLSVTCANVTVISHALFEAPSKHLRLGGPPVCSIICQTVIFVEQVTNITSGNPTGNSRLFPVDLTRSGIQDGFRLVGTV